MMKETTKAILIAVLMIATIATAINMIEDPKPTKLSADIAQQIIINIKEK